MPINKVEVGLQSTQIIPQTKLARKITISLLNTDVPAKNVTLISTESGEGTKLSLGKETILPSMTAVYAILTERFNDAQFIELLVSEDTIDEDTSEAVKEMQAAEMAKSELEAQAELEKNRIKQGRAESDRIMVHTLSSDKTLDEKIAEAERIETGSADEAKKIKLDEVKVAEEKAEIEVEARAVEAEKDAENAANEKADAEAKAKEDADKESAQEKELEAIEAKKIKQTK